MLHKKVSLFISLSILLICGSALGMMREAGSEFRDINATIMRAAHALAISRNQPGIKQFAAIENARKILSQVLPLIQNSDLDEGRKKELIKHILDAKLAMLEWSYESRVEYLYREAEESVNHAMELLHSIILERE